MEFPRRLARSLVSAGAAAGLLAAGLVVSHPEIQSGAAVLAAEARQLPDEETSTGLSADALSESSEDSAPDTAYDSPPGTNFGVALADLLRETPAE